jgi:hypothetical protein
MRINKISNVKEIEGLWNMVCNIYGDDDIRLYDINFNAVLEGLKTLPERYQIAMKARFIDNMTYKEISELLGVTSKSRPMQLISKSIRMLRYPKILNSFFIQDEISKNLKITTTSSIYELGISTRTFNGLTRNLPWSRDRGGLIINDILQIESVDELSNIREFGRISIKELLTKMKSAGFDEWVNKITNGKNIDDIKKTYVGNYHFGYRY